MLTDSQKQFVSAAAAAAVQSEKETGLPAELTLSQAIFESAYGTRGVGANIFGIKADHHGSGVQYVLTHEYIDGTWKEIPLAFEKYDSLKDCFDDHARLLTSGAPYATAWAQYQQDRNLDALIRGIGPVYATDPDYAGKILAEAHSGTVTAALATARGPSHASGLNS